ncbi:hypothetical protein COX23_05920, partial [Candidatus Gottesmanbacteria bacterium CG23_combo_of_CG06-09_8_20_14_all_37_19]
WLSTIFYNIRVSRYIILSFIVGKIHAPIFNCLIEKIILKNMIRLKVIKKDRIGEKIIGLLGCQKPIAIYIKTRFGIHTIGMKFPIDILILDNNNTVVKLKESFSPNRFFFWNPIYNIILELPPGTIKIKKIRLGSLIKLTIINK